MCKKCFARFCANIFERATYLRVIVRAHKSCAYADCRQIVNRTFSHVKFIQSIQSSIVYLSVSSRGGPSNLVQSHVDKKKSVNPPVHKGQFHAKVMKDVVIM